jgi:sulfatase maturation enzyme AslB (radical SAM superfamily)
MLAEDGDKTFRLGNLFSDSYERVMGSEFLVKTLRDTMTEGMPMCSDCGVMPYCGSDPVRHHQLQDDAIGFKPTSDHCRKHMNLIRHLIVLLADDQQASKILRSWV